MSTKLLLLITIISTISIAYLLQNNDSDFAKLSPKQMHQRIIKERDMAIQIAVKNGDYRCCIEPPCTMCYMEANQWNNYKAGTCACDDLIAQGKEPCPQCKQICNKDANGSCKVKNDI